MQICLRMWSRNTALMILLGALFLLAPAPSPAQQKALPALDQKLDPLRARFNQDAGKVRLIVIVDLPALLAAGEPPKFRSRCWRLFLLISSRST